KFYFMEMNTRIQVEHPVTEMFTDIDLIKEQIKIASGYKIDIVQEQIIFRGHAIECRINAENPVQDFAPSPGTIVNYLPPGGMGTRVDSSVYSGYTITPFYDSMICKIITHGQTRNEAIMKMKRALRESIIEGIYTTIPFHNSLLNHEKFISGNYDNNFLNLNKVLT